MRRGICLLGQALPAAALLLLAPGAAGSPRRSVIAFDLALRAARAIATMAADGSDVRMLSQGRVDDVDPSWSPDGRRLAFASDRSGRWQLEVMRSDGAHVARLLRDRFSDTRPAWSPKGPLIAFVRSTRGGGWIALVRPGHGRVRLLTRRLRLGGGGPAWSPDGSRIAFTAPSGVYVVPERGGRLQRVVADATVAGAPSWSRDGMRIAYGCARDGHAQLCEVAAGGGAAARVTDDSSNDVEPAYAPDGALSFSSDRGDYPALYETTGGGVVRLSPPGLDGANPDWHAP